MPEDVTTAAPEVKDQSKCRKPTYSLKSWRPRGSKDVPPALPMWMKATLLGSGSGNALEVLLVVNEMLEVLMLGMALW